MPRFRMHAMKLPRLRRSNHRGSIGLEYSITVSVVAVTATAALLGFADTNTSFVRKTTTATKAELTELREAKPDDAGGYSRNLWSFPSVYGASTHSTYISEERRHAEHLPPAGVTISGPSAEYSIEGAPWTALGGTIEPGERIRVRLTTGKDAGARYVASLAIGGVDRLFRVNTAP